MNVKALAAIVGALSLGSLATGCASTKSATTEPTEKGEEASPNKEASEAKGGEAACNKAGASTPTPEKGSEGSCGNGSCKK